MPRSCRTGLDVDRRVAAELGDAGLGHRRDGEADAAAVAVDAGEALKAWSVVPSRAATAPQDRRAVRPGQVRPNDSATCPSAENPGTPLAVGEDDAGAAAEGHSPAGTERPGPATR